MKEQVEQQAKDLLAVVLKPRDPPDPERNRTFLICPVRNKPEGYYLPVVDMLTDKGWQVYYPARDTPQYDIHGFRICQDNRDAIMVADTVHVIWDGESQGCLFDLGMAFTLRKPVIPLMLPPETPGKSFQNMIRIWSGRVTL